MRPIDADANIETMKKRSANPENEQALLCYRFTQRILEEAPTVEPASPWHRVDEPPDIDEYVHAFDGAFVGMASFDGEKWWQHDTFESFIISPSYWMPRIPDPPEEKTMKGE